MTLLADLLNDVEQRHPRSLQGLREARAMDPARFDAVAERNLGWLVKALGDDAIPAAVDAFVGFSTGVNLEQARYEAAGHYANKSYAECYEQVYADGSMRDYLWGVYLTNFLWSHHFEITKWFEDRYVAGLAAAGAEKLVEFAPGHGCWGVSALTLLPAARLAGFDISPSSIQIASSVAAAAGVADRATYEERSALETDTGTGDADGVICCFLIEHLEEPERLMASISAALKPRARAFVTGALTAAQVDHIFELRQESELVAMAERHGLRVVETFSGAPARTLKRARFLPRSMVLVCERRAGEIW